MFTFILHTIYDINGIAGYPEKCWPSTENDAILATLLQHEEDNFLKLTFKNRLKIDWNKSIPKNGLSDFHRNDGQQLPSLSHQKKMWISPEIISLPWRCSNLKSTRCRIWRRRNILSREMASLPLWCNSKRRTKRRNRCIKNSRPWHQCRQGRICFFLSVAFPCTIFLSLTYPRTWASPQKEKPSK